MHMIVKEKLPDEQSTGESVYHKLQALTTYWGTSASVIPCYTFSDHVSLHILCVIECFGFYNLTGPPLMTRVHKNGWLEEERVTPIEARSPGKIIEPY